MSLFLVFMFLVLVVLLLSYVCQPLVDSHRHLPPGPRPLPVIGNLLDVRGKLPHRSFGCLAERHGPLVTVRLGTTLTVVASASATAREILQKHNASLADRGTPDAWRAWGHDANSVFVLPTRHRWRALRRLGTERMFAARRLEELRPLRRDVVRELVLRVYEMAASCASVDVGLAAFEAMASLLSRAMFSSGLDAATSHELRGVVREFVLLTFAPNISEFFPLIAAADLLGVRRRMASQIARLYTLINGQVERRMRGRDAGHSSARKNDLLDVMLDMSEQDQSVSGLTVNQGVIRTFMTDLFIAGSDTSSAVIEWAMAELLRNPRAKIKMQEELRRVVGSKTHVEDDDIDQLPYLQAVLKETHRLHPAIPLLPYKTHTTIEIQGYTIPKGSTVIVNVLAIHQNSQTWIEPEKFIPERFVHTAEMDLLGKNFEFIPFSAGRRICLGMPLANRMLHVMLGSIMHHFEWTLPPEVITKNGSADMSEKFGVALSTATPLYALAKKM